MPFQLRWRIATQELPGPRGAGTGSLLLSCLRRVSGAAVARTAGGGIQPDRAMAMLRRSSPILDAARSARTYPASLLSVWKDYSPAVIGLRSITTSGAEKRTTCFSSSPRRIATASLSSTTRAMSRSPPATRWISCNTHRAPGARRAATLRFIRRRTPTGICSVCSGAACPTPVRQAPRLRWAQSNQKYFQCACGV